jgi:hypothetical protein
MSMQPASMQPSDMRAMDKKPVRADASAKRSGDYAGQKSVSRKGPQCNEKTAQY